MYTAWMQAARFVSVKSEEFTLLAYGSQRSIQAPASWGVAVNAASAYGLGCMTPKLYRPHAAWSWWDTPGFTLTLPAPAQ